MSAKYFLKLVTINFFVRILDLFIPKDDSIWLIGMDDGGGVRLSGNAWYLLDYLHRKEKDLRIVAVTSHHSVKEALDEIGVESVRPNTVKAFWLALRSGVNFICGELHDEIPNFSKRGTLKIHLWHGVPLKKIFYGSKKMMDRYLNRSFKMKLLEFARGKVELEEYDAIIYTSEGFRNIMIEAFNNPRVHLTGQPRDDAFYRPLSREKILGELGLLKFKDHKIICYLPTFRDSLDKRLNYKIFENCQESLDRLEKEKILVLQKDHNSILGSRLENGNVIHLTNEVETQRLLMLADVLVTDYSSVYIDFLHLQRPILFYCYDLEKYISQDRELYFDYFDDLITPGVKVKSEETLVDELAKAISNPSNYQEERLTSLKFFHHHQDGQNSRRVVELTKQLIQRKRGA